VGDGRMGSPHVRSRKRDRLSNWTLPAAHPARRRSPCWEARVREPPR
jgi:hypothetical protein